MLKKELMQHVVIEIMDQFFMDMNIVIFIFMEIFLVMREMLLKKEIDIILQKILN